MHCRETDHVGYGINNSNGQAKLLHIFLKGIRSNAVKRALNIQRKCRQGLALPQCIRYIGDKHPDAIQDRSTPSEAELERGNNPWHLHPTFIPTVDKPFV